MASKRKLDYFCTIKNDMEVSTFVKSNIPKGMRSLLSRLRNGSLLLGIEYGRYIRIPREERICELCGTDIEDAVHFLFNCSKLDECRQAYGDLTTDKDKVFDHPYKLGKMVADLWRKRQELLI